MFWESGRLKKERAERGVRGEDAGAKGGFNAIGIKPILLYLVPNVFKGYYLIKSHFQEMSI